MDKIRVIGKFVPRFVLLSPYCAVFEEYTHALVCVSSNVMMYIDAHIANASVLAGSFAHSLLLYSFYSTFLCILRFALNV